MMKKENLKEYKTLIEKSNIWCGEAVDALKKNKEKAWEECTSSQLIEFLCQLTSDNIIEVNRQSCPRTAELVDYYRRSFVSISLALTEMIVDAHKLNYPAWYDLVSAANAVVDNGKRKDGTLLVSKIKKFREQIQMLFCYPVKFESQIYLTEAGKR